jgi:hypothetical protein
MDKDNLAYKKNDVVRGNCDTKYIDNKLSHAAAVQLNSLSGRVVQDAKQELRHTAWPAGR